ncbi:uncharacterized protein LOC106477503 [Limulus polyphemus]|uniref:Uncharacterized protein LOC106477503 n=1 Tax=Limulus polyphemus TaxID=6850 RepID=A0ABM1C3H8_LIMPO|nr:uncharacterized protein LOC106477503 [Limulus polyphemus]
MPFVRVLANRIGNIRLLLCFFLIFSATTCLGLTFVPVVETKMTHDNLDFSMKCSLSSNFTYFYLLTNNSCSIRNPNSLDHLVLEIKNCSTNCSSQVQSRNTIDYCFVNTEEKSCGKLTANTTLTFEISNLVESIKFNKLPRNVLIYIIKGNITHGGAQYRNLICGSTNKLFLFESCHISCDVRSAGNAATCVGTQLASEKRYSRTFWMYLTIRLSVSLGIGILNGLFDATSIAVIKELDADIGYQRMWQAVAVCSFAPISGGLVDLLSAGKDTKDYSPCFYLYATLYIAGAFVSLFVDFSTKICSKKACKNLKILLAKSEIYVILFHVLILGISWGFLENFLFWFLESELGSPAFLLGVILTIGVGTSIPMTTFSTWITKNIGYVNVIIVAFVAYAIRYIGYSYAYNPYICLVYGTLENFTLTLSAVGIMLYCYHLVPSKTINTMKMLWISTHFIMGKDTSLDEIR